jgi:hypothetical protein
MLYVKVFYKKESYRLKAKGYIIFFLLSITYHYRLKFTLDSYRFTYLDNIRNYKRLKIILSIEILYIIH